MITEYVAGHHLNSPVNFGKNVMQNKIKQKTCGPMYRDSLTEFTDMDPDLIPVFAAGFVTGQAEKIYLGVCEAAMFRPSEKWWDTVMVIVVKVTERYGLWVNTLDTVRGREIWICASCEAASEVSALESVGEDSAEWHARRALLCGVPPSQIDYRFHERAGHDEPCDL